MVTYAQNLTKKSQGNTEEEKNKKIRSKRRCGIEESMGKTQSEDTDTTVELTTCGKRSG